MPDGDSVLLVSTATRGYGAARAPRALSRAGFDVTLLTPRNALAEHSRHLSRIAYLPEAATFLQWIHAFAGVVKAVEPVQAMPCDDMSFRLMSTLALSPPPQLRPELHAELAQLVHASLGDPAHYRESVDRTLLPAAAERAGLRTPPSAIVTTAAEAGSFAARHGYPLAAKRPHSSAGEGARIVADEAALAAAIGALVAASAGDLETADAGRVVLQKVIVGRRCHQEVAAWQGRTLAACAGDCMEPQEGDGGGPATVIHFRDIPELRELPQRLVAAFGISGLVGLEWVVEAETGVPYLVEVNRRIGPATHYGALLGVDLCAALRAALRAEPAPAPTSASASPCLGLEPGKERIFVAFPGEWLRDATSPWLRKHPVDMPWDDPQLLEAMLALRQGAGKA